MTENDELHDHEPIEQAGDDPCPAQDGTAMSGSGETAKVTGACGAPRGHLPLIDDELPTAIWAIEDLAERARVLAVRLDLTCEDPEWVKLIRSVNHPAAGLLGAQLQDRIGSERAWEAGRQRWKHKMKEIQRSLVEDRKDFESFERLHFRLRREGRLLLTKEEYHEKAIEDWLWDLDNLPAPSLTMEKFNQSNIKARESGEKWLAEVKAREHDFHRMKLDYGLDEKDLYFYREMNLALAFRGDSKLTRAEFWATSGRRFNPTRLSLYRALLGDLALPAASLE